MMLIKKSVGMSELEESHLMAVRDMWRSAKQGIKVCAVTVYECGWDVILGNYYEVVYPYVENGLIYHKVENSDKPELQLCGEDLDNKFVEMHMV